MKNKEDKEFELAKELFLKSYQPGFMLNKKTEIGYQTDINNAIAVAKMFIEEFEKKRGE